MPIDLKNAVPATPTEVKVTPGEAGVDLANAKTAEPPQANVQAQKLDGITEAGVDLARRVLGILSIVLVLLFVFYTIGEHGYVSLLDKPLDHHMKTLDLQGRTSSQFDDAKLNDVVATLKSIDARIGQVLESKPGKKPPPIAFDREPIDAAIQYVTTVKDGTKQDPAEAAKLAAVIAVLEMANTKPADLLKSRAKVKVALTTMQTAKRPVGEGEADKLKVINDLLKTMTEAHKEARASWFAMAQLVLINVLLPVLTALLGYIFGSSRRS
jgi:hypothetical protein